MTTAQRLSQGTLLRRFRMTAGLTQEELAAKAGVSARTISDLERGLTRRSHPDTIALLAEALELTAEERGTFEAARRGPLVAREQPQVPSPSEQVHYALPATLVPLTPLVGREREEAATVHLLRQPEVRLLTLTGPAGVGKTRLALQVATALRETFSDGVCFVALAPVREPQLVLATIAQALGLHDASSHALAETLAASLAEKQLLLVLDNFEQVVAAAPEVAALLAACWSMKALVTSRATLGVRGEHELAVPPLALPDGEHLPALDALGHFAAVTLFIQRARAARPTFALTENNAQAVAAICRRLDGLPLAIELAAPAMKLFSPQALLVRLESRLTTLAGRLQDIPERHRSLQQAITWSYDLLDASHQALFRRLAVFVGGWTIDAAEAVCSADEPDVDIVQAMGSLVDKSLVQRLDTTGDESRFGMLETIREFGLGWLEEHGERAALQQRHAQQYLTLAQAAEPELTGPDQVSWFTRLSAEHANLRAALQWAREFGAVEVGVRLAGSLFRYWVARAQREGLAWLEAFLALDADAGERAAPGEARAQALSVASYLAYRQGDLKRSTALARESVALCRELGDARGLAFALGTLGNTRRDAGEYEEAQSLHEESLALQRASGNVAGTAIMLNDLAITAIQGYGDFDRAVALFEEALALQRSVGNRNGTAAALLNLGAVNIELHAYERAEPLLTESLATFRELQDKAGVAHALQSLAGVAWHQGDFRRARAHYTESLRLLQTVGGKAPIVEALESLAEVEAAQGEWQRAVRLYAAAEALRAAIGLPLPALDQPRVERAIADLRGTLGDMEFAAVWEAGAALSLEQALAETVADTGPEA